ncbi:MAG: hypothetical protein GF392_00560 [Candidatus Omnitrophica bacterium]|nr:hypothetical protein [Candidatus Omnitrophota bacterium]
MRTAAFVLLMCIVLSPGVSRAVSTRNAYWDNGNIRVKKTTDDTGQLVGVKYFRQDGTPEQVIEYDEEGNKIGEAYYGENGKLVSRGDGWAAMRWKYENGDLRGEAYYDESGRLFEYKGYNREGDLAYRRYAGDKEPDPSEEYGPTPALSGETDSFYDEQGRPEGTTSVRFDDPGDPDFPPYWDPLYG